MILKLLSGVLDLGLAALGGAGRRRAGWRYRSAGLLAGILLVAGGLSSPAQWLTQTNVVVPGWSAIYFNVDASSQTLDSLVGFNLGCPIDQIWLWKTLPGTAQYVSSPAVPLAGNGQWLTYYRPSAGLVSSLSALAPNSAFLVHSSATTNFIWKVQGQPVPPSYVWDNTGLNFIGFSTPYANPPTFENFLAQAPLLAAGVQLYDYVGGPFSAQNPAPVYSLYTTPVTRGQAYWVEDTNINNTYFGPFSVNLPDPSGLNFGTSGGQFTFHLLNVTSNALTISLRLLPSETPPYGQTNIVGPPPLLVEGALNSTNLTYGFTALATTGTSTGTNSFSWTLPPGGQPGSDVSVVLGVNRFALTNGPAGSLYAGILQFTDSLGFSEVDVPVSANAANNAGLWVGNASVSQVGSYLKSYATNSDGSLISSAVTNQVFTTNGLPFITTNLVLSSSITTNQTVEFYNITNLVVNSYSTNHVSIVTNGYVVTTNLVINTYVLTNLVISSTVTNFYNNGSNIVWQSASTTNLFTSAFAITNRVPGTNQIAAVKTNNTPVVITNLAINYFFITNQVVTNGPFMSPVTNFAFTFLTLTNFTVTTNLAYNLQFTNVGVLTTATNFAITTNYATTNLTITALTVTNYVATNTALAIITNGLNAYVINPLVDNYSLAAQLDLIYNTNYFVISNNFVVVPGATNYLGSTTNQLSALSIATNSVASTNYVVTTLALSTNALYFITTNLLVTSSSNYVVTAVNTNLGAVPVPFPLRLIIFNDGTNSSLLQRVYYGYQNGGTNLVVATTQTALDPAQLGTARRISAAHMPWTAANNPIPFSGQLDLGGTLTASFYEDYGDQAANPFLHTYHPDHNNLDLTKSPPQELPVGSQSFDISRQITLTVAPNTSDFLSLTAGNTSLAGTYQETVTLTGLGGATRTFTSAGAFSLTRISPIATLTTQ